MTPSVETDQNQECHRQLSLSCSSSLLLAAPNVWKQCLWCSSRSCRKQCSTSRFVSPVPFLRAQTRNLEKCIFFVRTSVRNDKSGGASPYTGREALSSPVFLQTRHVELVFSNENGTIFMEHKFRC